MLSLLAVLLGLAIEPADPPAATHVSAIEIAKTMETSITNKAVDTLMKSAEVLGGKASVALLHRINPETSALSHDHVTEIYQIMEGAGTIVTGGRLTNAQVSDLTRVGAGMSHSGTPEGGETRRVGPNDIVIIPAGTPHRFSQLESPITYVVYRFDPTTAK